MSATRRTMMMGGKKKEYVSVFRSTFPGNGAVSGRNSFFIYLTETVTVGTKRLAMSFTAMDATLTQLGVRDSSASPADVVILMPQDSFDVEFEISERNTDILWCYFDKNATGVQIDMQTIKVDKVT